MTRWPGLSRCQRHIYVFSKLVKYIAFQRPEVTALCLSRKVKKSKTKKALFLSTQSTDWGHCLTLVLEPWPPLYVIIRARAKAVLSFLSYFKTLSIVPAPGIEPTSRSTVKSFTHWANPATVKWLGKVGELKWPTVESASRLSQSGGTGFGSRPDHQLGLFLCKLEFNLSLALVKSHLVFSRSVGFFKVVVLDFNDLFQICSAHQPFFY